MYESNPQNANFYYLLFDGDESLIALKQIYHINDDIIETLKNGLIFNVYTNLM